MKAKAFYVLLLLLAPAVSLAGDSGNTQLEYSDQVIISEILPNPEGSDAGEEWVELHNMSDQVISLDGWLLDDSSSDGSISSSAMTIAEMDIPTNGYLVIAIPENSLALNNSSKDSIRLFWPSKELVMEEFYPSPAKEGQSWCLIGEVYKWCTPTPGENNGTEDEDEEVNYDQSKIVFIEVLPDPEGTDAGFEHIKLQNQGSEAVNLKNWILDDGEKDSALGSSAFILGESILDTGEEFEVVIPKGKFTLNNSSKDSVRLFSPDKRIKDYIEYDKAKEGIAYISINGAWKWADEIEEEDGEVPGMQLPRTGMPVGAIYFVILLCIWYICHSSNKRNYEQTRVDRLVGS
ncbi:MAG TPA: lamin tail domain-containing protein [Candidatus Binatia bacterium]|nr:lamin tail domain-containing protein [Candidatus Binatia bacterium]